MEGKLKVKPFQIMELEDRIVLKRGVSTIVIPDKSAMIVVRVLQKALSQKAHTAEELSRLFAAKARDLVLAFIENLCQRNFIVSADDGVVDYSEVKESPQDIFYWHFNKHQKEIASRLNDSSWVFVGVNELSKRMISALQREGKRSVIVVDDPGLRKLEFFDDDFHCIDEFWDSPSIQVLDFDEFRRLQTDVGFLVAATEFGSFMLLEEWNEYAIRHQIPFYPAVLQNMVGYAGPLVIPGNGACLECLKLRQNSNNSDFKEKREIERFAFQNQHLSAYHNSMLTVLAEVAIFDLVKFSNNIQWEVGVLCEIDLLSGSMVRRKLMKAPRCKACSAASRKPAINIYKQMTTDAAWAEIEQTVGYDD